MSLDSKELFVKLLCTFLMKMEVHGGAKSKNRHPTSLYCTVVGLSEAATGGVLYKACSDKFCNIFRKKPVLGFLFNKGETLQVCNFLKRKLNFSVNIAKILRLSILKKRLLLDCFNGSLLRKSKCSDSFRFQDLSYRQA